MGNVTPAMDHYLRKMGRQEIPILNLICHVNPGNAQKNKTKKMQHPWLKATSYKDKGTPQWSCYCEFT